MKKLLLLMLVFVFAASGAEATKITWSQADTFNMNAGKRMVVKYISADTIATLFVSGNGTVTGNLVINGNTTIGNASGDALTFYPNAWTLTNAVTVTGTWTNLGTVTTVDINGGTVDATIIGGSTAAAGTFTTLKADSANFGTNKVILAPTQNIFSLDVDLSFIGAQTISTTTGNLTVNSGGNTILSDLVGIADSDPSNANNLSIYSNDAHSIPMVDIVSDNASGTGTGQRTKVDGSGAAHLIQDGTAAWTGELWLGGGNYDPVNDDAVLTIFNLSKTIRIEIVCINTSSAAVLASASIVARTAEASKSCAILSQAGAITVAASTSDLAGTTGVDGQITVSAHDAILEIENRSGVAMSIFVTTLRNQ